MEKNWVVTASYGELILKGKNRMRFVNDAERQIKKLIREIPVKKTYAQMGMFFIEVDEAYVNETVKQLQKVFGVIYVTPTLKVNKTLDDIAEACNFLVESKLMQLKGGEPYRNQFTFKVEGKRSDKSFPLNSLELSMEMGGRILDAQGDKIKVDVHKPDFRVHIDIRDSAHIYVDRYQGLGGLPWGSGGKGLLLLSGGIDSPAAGFEMARRGLEIGGVHFHAYPFTSERAQDKAIRLAKEMSDYVGSMKIFLVNIIDTYQAITKNCHKKNTTILSRRMMMRISDIIADKYGYDALITGESLGQVASQTIHGINVVNNAAKYPILRPFIATDKTRIIEIARKIGTYETSIEPHEDCCSIFAPDRPNTKPRLYDIEEEETKLDIDGLIQKALDSLKIIEID